MALEGLPGRAVHGVAARFAGAELRREEVQPPQRSGFERTCSALGSGAGIAAVERAIGFDEVEKIELGTVQARQQQGLLGRDTIRRVEADQGKYPSVRL